MYPKKNFKYKNFATREYISVKLVSILSECEVLCPQRSNIKTSDVKHAVSSVEEMQTCFSPRKLGMDVVSRLVTCAIRLHLNPTDYCVIPDSFSLHCSLQPCFSANRTHSYGGNHMWLSKALQSRLKLIGVIVTRKLFLQRCTVLKYVQNKLPGVGLQKFKPTPADLISHVEADSPLDSRGPPLCQPWCPQRPPNQLSNDFYSSK